MTNTFSNVSKIGLGTVQFGLPYGISNNEGQTPDGEVAAIFQTANDYGIHLIDTAFLYGESEKVIGKCLRDFPFQIVSKFPKIVEDENIKHYFRQSLIFLKRSCLYGYLAHDANFLIEKPEIWNDLIELKESNLVKKIGYSLYTTEQLERLLDLGFVPDLIQIPYNVLDRRFEKWMETLKSMGTEIHVRSAFLQGLFYVDINSLSTHFEEVKPKLRLLHKLFPNVPARVAALLQFCLNNTNVDKVIIGVNNRRQLIENLSSINEPTLSLGEDLSILDESILLPYNWPKST